MPQSLLPQLLHRLVLLVVAVAVVDMAAADTVGVDMAVLWPVATAWVAGTALLEAFTAGWVEVSVAR